MFLPVVLSAILTAQLRAGIQLRPYSVHPYFVEFQSAMSPPHLMSATAQTVMAGVATREAVCDARADYSLGVEDYPEAVKLHRRVVAAHPEDALAHYHLGFAYGMLGGRGEELAEYRRAASLGLKQWDLFLNLGLAYLEEGKLQRATEALTTAISLGPNHPEGHFNLGLTYERRGMLARARQEMLSSLRLDPKQRDARNMLGVIDAEDGDYTNARLIWFELARTEPDFAPARANLASLDRIENSAITDSPRGASSMGMSTLQPPGL